ncbi:MAG: hypothetical protein FWB85_11480 [Chitinispirillia bacterium]|nr:hypothetical protein [Chitinispirillia bacterium]
MGFSSIGGYNAYTQQFAANNTATHAETAKALLHDVRSQIAAGNMGKVGEQGDTVSISDGARLALTALLALQKDREAQGAETAVQARAEPPKEVRADVVQKRTDAVMRAYFQ